MSTHVVTHLKTSNHKKNWVADKLEQEIREKPNLTCEGAFHHMKRKCNVHIPYATIFRAMKEARKIVMGSEIEQYAKL